MVKKEIKIGGRIVCDGFLATVRYKGVVPPTAGEWLGVEWDNPSRGKHNGSKDGVKYFETSFPTSGSFIRPKKAEVGISCYAAIRERYGLVEGEHAGVKQDDMYIVGGDNKVTTVEVVGMEAVNKQQSDLSKLLEVVLRGMKVYGAAPDGLLAQHAANITELNLSHNLIPSWEELARITCQLKSLNTLDISENRLSLPENPSNLMKAFSSLKTLFMNRTNMSFAEILSCSDMWPQLETLHICFSDIKMLENPGNRLGCLKLLNMESNPLNSWSEVNKLSSLQSLETLVLNETGIDRIELPGEATEKTDKCFHNLKSLSLSRNKINQWSSVNELEKLQNLEEIRMKSNPICDTVNPETLRQLFIAKIGNLKMFNRTEVTAAERKGSEIDYLKRFGPSWLEAGGNADSNKNKPSLDFISQHPRYQKIVQLYGAAENSEMKQATSTLRDSLLPINITCPQAPPSKPITKKLPATMTVQKVKTLVNRLLKGDISTMKLSYITKDTDGPEIELDNDLRQLSFYSIEAGDTLIVRW